MEMSERLCGSTARTRLWNVFMLAVEEDNNSASEEDEDDKETSG